MNNDLAHEALDKFLNASNKKRTELAKAAGIRPGSLQNACGRKTKIKHENAELLYKAMHHIALSMNNAEQQKECLDAASLFDEAYLFALSRSTGESSLLKAAKADIAALIWLNGNCEYCKYGQKLEYSGAERWICSLGTDADCKPEWRGIEGKS